MERTELEKSVIGLVAVAYGQDETSLSVSTSFKTDLKGASVQMVGLVAEIENELDVMIPLQIASACDTIGDLCDKIEEEM